MLVLTMTPTPTPIYSVATTDFDSVFRRDYPRLVQALTLVCGDREVADDCVQEAFVRAHLRWRRISRLEDPSGWVRRVAINLARDEERRRRRSERVQPFLARSDEAPVAADTRYDLQTLVDALPMQQRTAVVLFYVLGNSVAEIAEAMELSEGAVKFHLHQGRKRLREHLAPSVEETNG